jgi:Tol biopolymer transport system component
VPSAITEARGLSEHPALSANGRYLAFTSFAPNLVADDTNRRPDVFRRDRLTGDIALVSVGADWAPADQASNSPAISADGRYVAFSSLASNLVAGDTNSQSDVFRRDVTASTTVRISVNRYGGNPNRSSYRPSISGDGQRVAFESGASNLVAKDQGARDVYVRDVPTGTTTAVSMTTPTDGDSNAISISADGQTVAFASANSQIVPQDTNGVLDVFVRNLTTGVSTRVSVDANGGDADGPSGFPAISGNGKTVAFESTATDLDATPGSGTLDIHVAALPG